VSPIAVVFALLLAATILAGIARRLDVPDPIVLVIGGLVLGIGLGAAPELGEVALEPDLVFLLFLPPILFGAAYFTSIRDFKANLRAILLLSVGLVLFTMTVVAFTAQWATGMSLAAAFALGAIVAPPDAVAATAVFQRLGVPRRMITILEGESLLNDATALVALRIALAGATALTIAGTSTFTFEPLVATADFRVVAIGGIVFGLVAGWLAWQVIARIQDTILAIVLTLLIPVGIYAPAEQLLHVSGVLAVVTAGLIAGRGASHALTSSQRILGEAVWRTVLFLINGSVFVLIGLQLPSVLREVAQTYEVGELIALGVLVSAVTILARVVWVFPGTYLPRRLSAKIRAREPRPPVANVAVVSWAGMRGVVSLAAALALPPSSVLPERSLIVFLTFCVIVATLVLQGITLPSVIRLLRVRADTEADDEERQARLMAAEAAVDEIGRLEAKWPDHRELVDQLRAQYEHRVSHIDVDGDGPRDEAERELLEHRQIRHSVIEAERGAVIKLRDDGKISDEVLRRVERDLDLEELRLEA
jgi:CPA1 family monovalent cation:H+ antiporter